MAMVDRKKLQNAITAATIELSDMTYELNPPRIEGYDKDKKTNVLCLFSRGTCGRCMTPKDIQHEFTFNSGGLEP